MAMKSVPPAPATSTAVTPVRSSVMIVRRESPNPTSLATTGTGTVATMAAMRSAQSRKSRSPSGMISSCAAFRWICRASARTISTARSACSGVTVGPTLASTKACGASRRMMRKPSARSGSSRAMRCEPQAIATSASAAAPARPALTAAVARVPPVIALM